MGYCMRWHSQVGAAELSDTDTDIRFGIIAYLDNDCIIIIRSEVDFYLFAYFKTCGDEVDGFVILTEKMNETLHLIIGDDGKTDSIG